MGTLLDTSVLIDYERADTRLPDAERFGITAITASELLHGVHRGDPRRRAERQAALDGVMERLDVFAFDLNIARVHARLWADLAEAGVSAGAHDLQIAATAISLGWPLATLDERAFGRIPGLRLRKLLHPARDR